MCIKGSARATSCIESHGARTVPLLREKGAILPFQPTDWNTRSILPLQKIKEIQAIWPRCVAVVSTGQLMTEEFYTLGKLCAADRHQ